MRVDRMLLYIFICNLDPIKSIIVVEDDICHGPCFSNKCTSLGNGEPVHCYPDGTNDIGVFPCETPCESKFRDDILIGLTCNTREVNNPQNFVEANCSIHVAFEIWDSNYFQITNYGILIPIRRPLQGIPLLENCLLLQNGPSEYVLRRDCTMDFNVSPTIIGGALQKCERSCESTGNCGQEYRLPPFCPSILPNYLHFGPAPSQLQVQQENIQKPDCQPRFEPKEFQRDDSFDSSTWYKRDWREAEHCTEGLFYIEGDSLSLGKVYEDTKLGCGFRGAPGSPARFITIVANIITVDMSVIVLNCKRLILAAKQIIIVGQPTIQLNGTSFKEYSTDPDNHNIHPSSSSERRPDDARGRNGGKVILMASQWSFESLATLQIGSIGGDSACGSKPRFAIDIKDPLIDSAYNVYYHIKFLKPLTEMSFEYEGLSDTSHFDDFDSSRIMVGFKVYNSLELVENKAGCGQDTKVFGLKNEQLTLLRNYTIHGKCRVCKNASEIIHPQLKVKYITDNRYYGSSVGLWLVKKTEALHSYSRAKNMHDYFLKLDILDQTDIRDFELISSWAYMTTDKWTQKEQFKFLADLRIVQADLNAFSISHFYSDLRYLIIHSKNIDDEDELKILQNIRKQLTANFDSSNTFLKWIYATAAAQEMRTKSETGLIINLFDFVVQKEELLTKLYTAEERTNRVKAAVNEYESINNDKINAAEELLKNDVMPTLNDINQNLELSFDQLRNDSIKLFANAEKHKGVLKANLKSVRITQITSTILNGIGAFASALGWLGPVSAAVGGLISTGASAVNSVVEESYKPEVPPGYKMPESIKREMNPVVSWIERKQARLESQIDAMINELTGGENLEEVITFLVTCLKELRKDKRKHEQYGTIKKVEKMFKDGLDKFRAEYSSNEPQNRKPFTEEEKEKQDLKKTRLEAGAKAFEFAGKAVTGFLEKKKDIEKLENEIKEVDEDLKELEAFMVKFENKIIPMIIDIMQSFDYISLEMNNTHLASIDVTQWSIASNIKDIKHEMRKVLSGFPSWDDIQHGIEKIETFLDAVSDIFKNIANIKNQKVLASFNANLAKSTVNPVYETFVKNMDHQMTNAVIQSEVTSVLNGFRKWAFPFVSVFLTTLPELQLHTGDDDPKNVSQRARETVAKVRNVIQNYNNVIEPTVDKFKQQGQFYRNQKTGLYPFYIWDHAEYAEKIYSLLSGEITFFTADIKQLRNAGRHYDKEAIKFNSIGINFHVQRNPYLSTKLNELLSACKMFMVHKGYSYFNFDGKVYLFTGPEITLSTSYDKSTKNFGSIRLEGAEPVLSPYGIWKFGLHTHDGRDFSELIKLLQANPKINMELIGDGSFVGTVLNEKYLDPHVEKYFEPVDDFPKPTARDLEWDDSEWE